MIDAILLIILIILIATSCIGAGKFLISFVTGKNNSYLNISFWYFAGEIFLTTIWSLLVFFFTPFFCVGVIVFALVIFSVYCFVNFRIYEVKINTHINFDLMIVSMVTLLLLIFFVNSFYKPFEWDEVAYHYSAMNEISNGKLHFPLLSNSTYVYFYKPFSYFYGSLPYSFEAFSSILYKLSGNNPASSHIVNFSNLIFFIMFLVSYLVDIKKQRKSSVYAVLLLILLNSNILILHSLGLVDLSVAYYQILTIFTAIMSRKNINYLYLSSFFIGYAIGIKYTAVYLIPVIVYVCIIRYKKYTKGDYRVLIKLFSIHLLIMLFSGGYWYVKNFMIHGNPVYPLYFGHIGMSGTLYTQLTNSLIYDIRGNVSLNKFYINLVRDFSKDISLLLLAVLTTMTMIINKIKLSHESKLLLLSAFLVYLFNFLFGSQLIRYVLFTPIILIVVMFSIVDRQKVVKYMVLLTLFITLVLPNTYSGILKSKIDTAIKMIAGDYVSVESQNVGCGWQVSKKLIDEKVKAVNFWDPYTAMFFENENIFDYPESLTLDKLSKYLYINTQYKESFVNNKEFHSDIDIDKRLKLESELKNNRSPVFVNGNCMLYNIDNI